MPYLPIVSFLGRLGRREKSSLGIAFNIEKNCSCFFGWSHQVQWTSMEVCFLYDDIFTVSESRSLAFLDSLCYLYLDLEPYQEISETRSFQVHAFFYIWLTTSAVGTLIALYDALCIHLCRADSWIESINTDYLFLLTNLEADGNCMCGKW